MDIWNVIARVADIVTIIGLPVTAYSLIKLLYNGIVIYDAYREENEKGSLTYVAGRAYTRRDRKLGKKINPTRQYHRIREGNEDDNWE